MTDLDRRRFMMTGLAGLPLAAVLADAKLAWQRTLDFYQKHLRG